jgi:hypothetical protein
MLHAARRLIRALGASCLRAYDEKGKGYMTKEGYAKLTLILSLVAAALALSAALVGYTRRGEVNIALIAAALFLVAFGFGAKGRIAR